MYVSKTQIALHFKKRLRISPTALNLQAIAHDALHFSGEPLFCCLVVCNFLGIEK